MNGIKDIYDELMAAYKKEKRKLRTSIASIFKA